MHEDLCHQIVKNTADQNGENHEAKADDKTFLGDRPVVAILKECAHNVHELKELTLIHDNHIR